MSNAVRAAGRVLAVQALAIAVLGAGAALAQTAPAAAPIGVITVKKTEVPRVVTVPGRAVAYQQADIRPRVDGIITKILYTPGTLVKEGDPLFQLDDASYQATVAADQAAVDKAAAIVPTDQSNYDRAVKLEGQGYTEAQVETLKSTLEQDKASLAAAQAALAFAQIQLGWTTVRSPIEGYPEVPAVTVGNLVSAAQATALTQVTRLDPIDVDVLEPSANILSIRNLIEQGVLTPSAKLQAQLTLEDGQTYTGLGQLVAPSWTVSTSTGTVSFRFRFDNADHKILPGMFLRATVQLGTVSAFLVPQLATTVAPDGMLSVYVVRDGKAQAVQLTEIGSYKNNWIVPTGLNEGDQLIVDGLKYMAPGRPITPVPATIDADGAVHEQAPAGSGAASN